MNFFKLTVLLSIRYPQRILKLTGGIALLLLCVFPLVAVDVDPESMLSEQEPVRVLHHEVKTRMELYDMLVLGITHDEHAEGVFNPESLARLSLLADGIAALEGVVAHELLSPGRVDAIEPAGPGTVRFERVMPQIPQDQEAAERVRQRLTDNPFLWETMVSTDQKAMAIYIPVIDKDYSWRVSTQIKGKIAAIDGPEKYHLAGLPVAEDTFGVEMFIQMAISAPLAMLLIGFLIWFFVRNLWMTGAALLLAMLSVIITMGLFIATGNTLHIMSSMIPIFIMPIAVLDAVHILSQFFDGYAGKRQQTLKTVMRELWKPMLFTSLTTAAGFMSLMLAPIPPIQAFGLFTGLGVLIAWLLSMTFMPAFICIIPDKTLVGFGAQASVKRSHLLALALQKILRIGWSRAYWVLGLTVLLSGLAIVGINRLAVNDNPVKWFTSGHDIRQADRLINERFGGSYLVYLSLSQAFAAGDTAKLMQSLNSKLVNNSKEEQALREWLEQKVPTESDPVVLLNEARQWVQAQINSEVGLETVEFSLDDAELPSFEMEEDDTDNSSVVLQQSWVRLDQLLESELLGLQLMKQPEMLSWLDRMANEVRIGNIHGIQNLVKKVNKELHEGDAAHFNIPDTAPKVMESYLSFQSSHDLNRLWHMITPDYARATLLIQLKTGDNQDVAAAVERLREWINLNPPPYTLNYEWSGLAYLNIIWQEKMVSGMLKALLGSLVIVLLMMLYLYRNLWWALLPVVPLCLSILLVYGLLGLLGKDYDMPVAVLSALALGLAVDFAIHFITHTRHYAQQAASPQEAVAHVFGEPGRAIMRNAIVIILGFSPLLIAPLVPYQTVGYLMMAIMLISALATFYLLPAVLSLAVLRPFFFPATTKAAVLNTTLK